MLERRSRLGRDFKSGPPGCTTADRQPLCDQIQRESRISQTHEAHQRGEHHIMRTTGRVTEAVKYDGLGIDVVVTRNLLAASTSK